MKKVSLFIIALVLVAFTNAQAQRFGFKGGINIANMASKSTANGITTKVSGSSKIGFHLGPIIEFEISEPIYFQTGLLLSLKGSKQTIENSAAGVSVKVTNSINPMYLEVPLHGMYKAEMGNITGIFKTGPYLAFGIGGNFKNKGKVQGLGVATNNKSTKIKWGNSIAEGDDYKALDFGWGVGMGIEANNLQFILSYDFGIANIQTGGTSDFSTRNKVIGISAAYFFE